MGIHQEGRVFVFLRQRQRVEVFHREYLNPAPRAVHNGALRCHVRLEDRKIECGLFEAVHRCVSGHCAARGKDELEDYEIAAGELVSARVFEHLKNVPIRN